MRKHFLYKHDNNTDVALMPLDIAESGDVYKIKCRWFNIVNPKNVFDLGVVDSVEIKSQDLKKWKIYEQI
jgi:hypothetical protein